MKSLSITLAALLAMCFMLPAPSMGSVEPVCTATMWAGQHTNVGTVTATRTADGLEVSYETTGGWTLTEVHVQIGGTIADIPQNKGGPIPGRFQYKSTASGTTHVALIPQADLPSGELVILAHAVVANTAGDGAGCTSTLTLPTGVVDACFSYPGTDTYAIVDLVNAGDFNGTYGCWCVDLERGLGDCLGVIMRSSLDPTTAAAVDRGENLDLVNYLMNQDYSALGAGRDEIQSAIWALIDDGDWRAGGGVNPDESVVLQILADVYANGEGFVPGAGDLLAVILDPQTPSQTMMMTLRLPECPPPTDGGTETAWAGDLDFPGKNWALYFTCD